MNILKRPKRLFLVVGCLLACHNLVNAAAEAWSNKSTWGGSVPTAGAAVMIPAGKHVVLDVETPLLKSLMVHGTLEFKDKPGVGIHTGWLMVMGEDARLQIGSESEPFVNKTHLTFYGTDENFNAVTTGPFTSGNKFLMAMGGGTISLHGATASKTAWTKLDSHAKPGDTSIRVLDGNTGWKVGDKLCIAPSGHVSEDAESVTITSIDGKNIGVSPALSAKHWGTLQYYDGQAVDQRAPVGLLSRNIVVQGAEDSDAGKFGAHTMIMGRSANGVASRAYIEGVEFTRGGQLGHQGRYSFHWHWVFAADGQYIRDCSIHHGFQRAVNVHRTSGVVVENNVAFRIPNHNYVWAEDGVETEFNNTFLNNLAVQVIQQDENVDPFAFGSRATNNPVQEEWRTSAFWGRNAFHHLEGNHAAGVNGGFAYFYDTAGDFEMNPLTRFFKFHNNTAQSITDEKSFLQPGNDLYPPLVRGVGLFITQNDLGDMVFSGLNAFKCKLGVWVERDAHIIRDAVLTDNAAGMLGMQGQIEDSLIVGNTANDIGRDFPLIRNSPATLVNTIDLESVGVFSFDGQGSTKTIKATNLTVLKANAALYTEDASAFHGGYFSGIKTDASTPPFNGFGLMNGAILDKDGMLDPKGLGRPTWLAFGDQHFIRPDSVYDDRLNAWLTPENGKIAVFDASEMVPYGPVDGNIIVRNDGLNARVEGRGGVAIPFEYTVTENTVMEFMAMDYYIKDKKGWNFVGIGLDEDLNAKNGKRLFGTERADTSTSKGRGTNRDFSAYSEGEAKGFYLDPKIGESRRVYRIPVGEFYTGEMKHLVVYGDPRNDVENDAFYDYHVIRVYEKDQQPKRGNLARREIWRNLKIGGDGKLTFEDFYNDNRYPNKPDEVVDYTPYYGSAKLDDRARSMMPYQREQGDQVGVVEHSYFTPPVSGVYTFTVSTQLTNFELAFGKPTGSGTQWLVALWNNDGDGDDSPVSGSIELDANITYKWRFTTVSKFAAAPPSFAFTSRGPGDSKDGPLPITAMRPPLNNLEIDDADFDGLSNEWELANGFDPFSAEGVNGPDGDRDGDGVSNQEEEFLGLSPFEFSSIPQAWIHRQNDGSLLVRFPGKSGRQYQLQHSSNLSKWDDIGSPKASASAESTLEWPVPSGDSMAFFRVKIGRN